MHHKGCTVKGALKLGGKIIKNILITIIMQAGAFLLCLLFPDYFKADALIPAIFILAVFLTSVITDGYFYGIFSALIGVLAVNYAFTFPFFKFNFMLPGNLISAIIMIVVALITCGLTVKIKKQESIEAESERERMRANLMRAVSHDLRTPLTTIYSSCSAIMNNYNEFSDKQKVKMLGGIKEDAQWLGRMVENLLSITRLDGGNVKIIKTETVLDELIDSVLIKLNKRYPNQRVRVDIPEDFIAIPMDAILIEQVILNILENAVQHAKGMTELTLKVFVISGRAVFEISDNGCGIAEERLKNIFTGYYGSDSVPTDGNNRNAGIGLSVCASIIKAHGGEIRGENLKDGGAVFRFSLDIGGDNHEQ